MQTRLQGIMEKLLDALRTHKDAWPFHTPVDPHEVPDYYAIIKDPIGTR
jgi:histone acetyltransferase